MEQDRSEALASVTIDSSLIYPTTSRRFLMALWEMEGLKVELLPRTIQEMYGFVQDSERSYWRRALAREAGRTGRTWPPETVEAVAAATAAAAGEWVNTEIGYAATAARNDSMLCAVGLTTAQEARAGAIAETIPNMCFKGPSKDGHRGDREIVAQGRGQRLQNPGKRQPDQHPAPTDERLAARAGAVHRRLRAARRRRDRGGRTMARPARAPARGGATSNAPGQTRGGDARERHRRNVHRADERRRTGQRRDELQRGVAGNTPQRNLRPRETVHRGTDDARERNGAPASESNTRGSGGSRIREVIPQSRRRASRGRLFSARHRTTPSEDGSRRTTASSRPRSAHTPCRRTRGRERSKDGDAPRWSGTKHTEDIDARALQIGAGEDLRRTHRG